MKDDPYFYAQHTTGERSWEIGVTASRRRICADMTESVARDICALLNAASPLATDYNIPVKQIAAIWRLVKDNGGINEA